MGSARGPGCPRNQSRLEVGSERRGSGGHIGAELKPLRGEVKYRTESRHLQPIMSDTVVQDFEEEPTFQADGSNYLHDAIRSLFPFSTFSFDHPPHTARTNTSNVAVFINKVCLCANPHNGHTRRIVCKRSLRQWKDIRIRHSGSCNWKRLGRRFCIVLDMELYYRRVALRIEYSECATYSRRSRPSSRVTSISRMPSPLVPLSTHISQFSSCSTKVHGFVQSSNTITRVLCSEAFTGST